MRTSPSKTRLGGGASSRFAAIVEDVGQDQVLGSATRRRPGGLRRRHVDRHLRFARAPSGLAQQRVPVVQQWQEIVRDPAVARVDEAGSVA